MTTVSGTETIGVSTIKNKKGKFEQPRSAAAKAASRSAGKQTKEKAGRKKKKTGRKLGIVLTVLLIAVLVLGVYLYGGTLQNGQTIYPNVYVAGVNVGGMRQREARSAVDEAVTATYAAETLRVMLPDRTLSFDPTQTKVALDSDEAVAAAMAYGREGNCFTAVLDYIRSKSGRYDIDVETSMNLDTDYIRNLIDQTAREVALDAKSSSVDYNEAAGTLTVQVGTPAVSLDADGLYEAVCNAYATGNMEPFSWDYIETPVDALNLNAYYNSLCTEAKDAYYDEDSHTIVESVTGYGFDLETAQQQLENVAAGSQIILRMEYVEPEVTKEQLTNQMFGTKLQSRSSPYNAAQTGRTKNLELACEAINGTILNPGEVFSFNGIVGERTEDKGYQEATVFADGGANSDELGGGVCQVASTIYLSTLYLNLEQVHREPHMYRVTYVPEGMDATVYWGSIDYQFKNTLDFPIKIQANIDGGNVNITFWGAEELDYYVEMTSTVLTTFSEPEEEVLDETKPVGFREQTQTAYTGANVEAYQKVYDKSGSLLEQHTITSHYSSRPAIYTVGPAETPADPDPSVSDPDPSVSDPDDDADYDGGNGEWWP